MTREKLLELQVKVGKKLNEALEYRTTHPYTKSMVSVNLAQKKIESIAKRGEKLIRQIEELNILVENI